MDVWHLPRSFPSATVEFWAQTLCGCLLHPWVASTKILAESEAPRRSYDICSFRACLLAACCLLDCPLLAKPVRSNLDTEEGGLIPLAW